MRVRLLNLWHHVRGSYWLVPALMVGGACVLAFATVAVDGALGLGRAGRFRWAYTGGPEGARTLLSTLAGSMITVAGVTFSITMVALTLASSQCGPRLLANFKRDAGSQVVLGTFLATFLYSLLVLRTVQGGEDPFVPHVSVTVALVLAVASLGVLIYFIHHVSELIQVDRVAAAVARDLDGVIDAFSRPRERAAAGHPEQPAREAPAPDEGQAAVVPAARGGYLQAVDEAGLLETAVADDLLIRLEHKPGDFLVQEGVLARVWPPERLTEAITTRINGAVILGDRRTAEQDIKFCVDELVEIAVRALSPGVNDPFTATICIDRLTAGLARFLQRELPPADLCDECGRLRLVVPRVTTMEVVDAAFNHIRECARGSAPVTIHLLQTLALLAGYARTEEGREALRRQAAMIHRGARAGLPEEWDRQVVEERYQAVLEALARKE